MRYAIMTKRGFRLTGNFIQEYPSSTAAIQDMSSYDQLILIPQAGNSPGHGGSAEWMAKIRGTQKGEIQRAVMTCGC